MNIWFMKQPRALEYIAIATQDYGVTQTFDVMRSNIHTVYLKSFEGAKYHIMQIVCGGKLHACNFLLKFMGNFCGCVVHAISY